MNTIKVLGVISIEAIIEKLLNKKIKPSFPRIKVLEYLLVNKNHSTVDEIYNGLVKEIPTLSRTTVYNSLNLFTKANLVRVVQTDGHEARYDATVLDHGHFRCEECKKIYDFSISTDNMVRAGLSNFKIKEKSIYYQGICADCLGQYRKKLRRRL